MTACVLLITANPGAASMGRMRPWSHFRRAYVFFLSEVHHTLWWGLCAALVACGGGSPPSGGPSATEERVLNVYNWYDYISPEVLREFTARYGIQVHYNVFDSNNTLAAKLLAGHSGYDVVFPSGAYLESLIAAGVFRTLDKSKLPNLKNMDPAIMQRLAAHDPGNAHAVVYTWGITGIAYNAAKVRDRLPQAPVDSWSLMFDPKVVAQL